MKRLSAALRLLAACLLAAYLPTACVDTEEFDDDHYGNFQALWTILDEHYCYFSEKQIDWDAVRAKYAIRINQGMTTLQLFEVMANMLAELRDGHVNLYASFDVARNWSWQEDYPSNFSDTLYHRYMGTDYRIAGTLRYRILDDNIGYVRCASFETANGNSNVSNMLTALAPCNGLIIDVRNNGGGLLTAAEMLAAFFTNEEILVGYMQHKTGTGHDDFSAPEEQRLRPANGARWQKPVVVLTNRSVFSAANEFVKYMKCCPQVTIVGDRTGGGSGLPMSSELPNGWSVRYSACPMYDREMHSTEFGIAPDHNVSLTDDDFARGIDTIIEYARQLLHP